MYLDEPEIDDITLEEWTDNEAFREMMLDHPNFVKKMLDYAVANNQLERVLLCNEDAESIHASIVYNNAITLHHVNTLMVLLDYSTAHFEKYPKIAETVVAFLVHDYINYRVDFENCTQRALQHPCFQPVYDAYLLSSPPKMPLDRRYIDLPNTGLGPDTAIEKTRVLLQRFKALLADEGLCQPYFAQIESDLQKAVETDNQQGLYQTLLNKQNYTRKRFDDLTFPVPNANFEKTRKSSLLMRVLQTRLRSHSCTVTIQRWAGKVPDDRANDLIQNKAVLFTESQYGGGLFHGKFMHLIQLCMLGEFMKNNPELTSYENGSTLSLSQVITHMVSFKLIGGNKETNWWNVIIDSRFKSYASFTDPYQLHAYLLSAVHLPYLSAYLRDSFCGGFLDLLNAMNEGNEITFTSETFSALLSNAGFDAFNFPAYLHEVVERDYLTPTDNKPLKHTRMFSQKPEPDAGISADSHVITGKHYQDVPIALTPFKS